PILHAWTGSGPSNGALRALVSFIAARPLNHKWRKMPIKTDNRGVHSARLLADTHRSPPMCWKHRDAVNGKSLRQHPTLNYLGPRYITPDQLFEKLRPRSRNTAAY